VGFGLIRLASTTALEGAQAGDLKPEEILKI